MRYVGGKDKLKKKIAARILETTSRRDVYLEPFCGGGSVLGELGPHFRTVIASDLCEDLILMWQAFKNGWEPDNYISEFDYQKLRNAQPSALRGLIGFGQSFGGKWFGGYARGQTSDGRDRNYLDETIRNIKGIISKLPANTEFLLRDYRDSAPDSNSVAYSDPPYSCTQGYSSVGEFDTGDFWRTMESWADEGAHVFVSEYQAPSNWTCLEQYSHRQSLSLSDDRFETTEKLWHR
jgi:DNA adenine methylase